MCGVLGLLLPPDGVVIDFLQQGLLKLEYRGYDSCGIAISDGKDISCYKSEGYVSKLFRNIPRCISGNIGIAHTRWATHGSPSLKNAHPIRSDGVYVVHNGIIDNYVQMKVLLEEEGFLFVTDTDTEVIAHYIASKIQKGMSPFQAVSCCMSALQGRFAVLCMFDGCDFLIGFKKFTPLVVGFGDNVSSITSDVYACSSFLHAFLHLEDNDIAVVYSSHAEIYNDGVRVFRELREFRKSFGVHFDSDDNETSSSFMLKEIFDQPSSIRKTMLNFDLSSFLSLGLNFQTLDRITIVGCGSSYFASNVAKYWFQSFAKIRVYVEIASEFYFNDKNDIKGELVLFVSQSGETTDTIEALKRAKKAGAICVNITNAPESTIERISDASIHTFAGSEIGVASTKTFSSQLIVFARLVLFLGKERMCISESFYNEIFSSLEMLPSVIDNMLINLDVDLEPAVSLALEKNKCIMAGRGIFYGIAMEGALKVREIAYISTIGISAGELKHGTIALVDEDMPVVFVSPNMNDALFYKTFSNIREVSARNGFIICITDSLSEEYLRPYSKVIIKIPDSNEFSSPILTSIPLQLLAYKLSVVKGLDADRPRNLAKSVTVE